MRRVLTGIAIVLFLASVWLTQGAEVQAGDARTTAPTSKYKVGDVAPDFTLKDQNGKDVSLHQFRGKHNVVLAFYVFAFTGG